MVSFLPLPELSCPPSTSGDLALKAPSGGALGSLSGLEPSPPQPCLSWADESGWDLRWGVVLGCYLHGHFRGPHPPSALPGPGSPQAGVFHILSPFLSLSRGQWQPEESEDYVSNRCASAGKTWVRLGSRVTPSPPPLLPARAAHIRRAPATSGENRCLDGSTELSSDWRFF